MFCVRYGRRSFHLQKNRCVPCGYPAVSVRKYNWSIKAILRKTTGTGLVRYLVHVAVRFESNFREGTEAAPRKKGAAADELVQLSDLNLLLPGIEQKPAESSLNLLCGLQK